MKGIRINECMVIRESIRQVNRDSNSMFFVFSLECLKGVILSDEILKSKRSFSFDISKVEDEDNWIYFKDIANENLMLRIYEILHKWNEVKNASPPCLITQTVEDPTNGSIDIPIGYEEESDDYMQRIAMQKIYPFLNTLDGVEIFSMEVVEI